LTTYINNFSITSAQAAWFKLKQTLVSSTTTATNWVITTSSNGTVYAQSGDVITSVASLAANSWFVAEGHGIVDSGVVVKRQLCFQFNGAGAVRITYSPRLGFTAGTPSTTQVPSALDGQLLWGGGTDASPTFTALFPSGGAWMQAAVSEVDDAFWVFTYDVGGSLLKSLFFLEPTPLIYTLGGALVDGDPCVLYAGTGADCGRRLNLASESRGAFGMLGQGIAPQSLWARLAAAYCSTLDSSDVPAATIPGGMVSQPSLAYAVPTYRLDTLSYGRRTALTGTTQSGDNGNVNTIGAKGEGSYLRWSGTLFALPTLVDLIDPTGMSAGTVIGVGDLFFPWTSGMSLSL
jgi:hypothetical protein